MAEAVIVEAMRSPIGKRNGGLSGIHPADVSAPVLDGPVREVGIEPKTALAELEDSDAPA
jgi:acetyl-CoA acyltransferase